MQVLRTTLTFDQRFTLKTAQILIATTCC